MSFSSVVLWLHVIAGFAALALGLVAMGAKKVRGLHTHTGEAYHWTVLLTCVLASVLSILEWNRIWWFLPIALGSYAFAFVGYLSAKIRWKHWLLWHVSGQGGSYIAMTTALLVVNWHSLVGVPGVRSPIAWALPTLIGSPIIALINRRLRKRQNAVVKLFDTRV